MKNEKYNQPLKIYENEIVPDRTAEIEKEMQEASRWEAERMEKERLHKERIKQDRINKTLIDKYTHALDLIIERAEFAGNEKNFDIRFYDFNFQEMIGSKILKKFLKKLQNNECFEKYIRENYNGGTRFCFLKINIKNLKKFKIKNKKIKNLSLRYMV